MSYSVAIRTLGTNLDCLIRLLKSLSKQTVKPDEIYIYIAEGYAIPNIRISNEIYIPVKKGMMRQRILDYKDIKSPYVLMLDDDVELAPDSAKKLLQSIAIGYDCVAADTFENHNASIKNKLYSFLSNMTFPHFTKKKAFVIHGNATFSYLNRPTKDLYKSDSAAGPASMWEKETFTKLHYEDELWLEKLGFCYGDDQLIFNKIVKNGMRLGVLYNSGIINLDAQTASNDYKIKLDRFRLRAEAIYLLWHRSCYNLDGLPKSIKISRALNFTIRLLWMIPPHIILALKERRATILSDYFNGIKEGFQFTKTEEYKRIPNYILSSGNREWLNHEFEHK